MLGAELATLNHPSVERIRQFYQANEEKLATLLEDGCQDGSFRFTGDIRAMAALIFELLEGGMLIARVRGGAAHFHRTIEQLMQLVKG